MNNQKYQNPKNWFFILLLSCFSSISIAQENGLELILNEKEQSLLNSFEQKNQADSLIKLLETLEKLSEYPIEAIDELTGKNPNHQVINRVIKRLKQAQSNSNLEALNFDSAKDSETNTNHRLIPVFAAASSDNGITAGRVIFQNPKGIAISATEGQPFIYGDGEYELLSITPKTGTQGQFNIRLKTPTSTQQYIWPR